MIGIAITAWLDVRSKPLRTLAAVAGMVAAIVAVVLVDAASTLSRTANDEFLLRNYGLPVTLSISDSEQASTVAQQERVLESMAAAGFPLVSRVEQVQLNLVQDGSVSFISAQLVNSTYRQIRVVDLLYGAWPVETAGGMTLHAVVTVDVARQFGFADPAAAVGAVLTYTYGRSATVTDLRMAPQHTLVIDGVADTTTNAFDSSGVLIVNDLPEPSIRSEWSGFSRLVRTNPADAGALREIVAKVVDETGRSVFTARRIDQSESLSTLLEQQEVTARIVTIIALTIGGLGVLGTGIAGVRERTREFGLRRAIGASKPRIFAGVIVQTLMEVTIAALAAIFIAAVLLERFARQLVLEELPLPASTLLPVDSALLGLGGALLVGLIAGSLPAWTAAKSSVVMALRS